MARNLRIETIPDRLGYDDKELTRAVAIIGAGYGTPASKLGEVLGIKSTRLLGRALGTIPHIKMKNPDAASSRKIWYVPPQTREKIARKGVKNL